MGRNGTVDASIACAFAIVCARSAIGWKADATGTAIGWKVASTSYAKDCGMNAGAIGAKNKSGMGFLRPGRFPASAISGGKNACATRFSDRLRRLDRSRFRTATSLGARREQDYRHAE